MKVGYVLGCLLVFSCLSIGAAEEKDLPTCALLPLSREAGVSREEAALVTKAVRDRLHAQGKYRMLTGKYVEYERYPLGVTGANERNEHQRPKHR